MKKFLYSWLISLILILALDMLWISLTLEIFYKVYLGSILSEDFKAIFAVIFYGLYAFGISYLVIFPSLELKDTFLKVCSKGFVLGLVAYSTYDLTNQALIKDWPLIVTVVDILWGSFLTAMVSSMTYRSLYRL